ncbi:hypothetical protein C8J57DRAFT_1649890 [Mycena rebaudengoi]|nr:hypothetical protein C8J57DRAFT_1649890 [Mycena rebaudengoi]
MPITKNVETLLQYIILAATTTKNIAETAKVPFLGSTAILCLSITKCIELDSASEIRGVLPTTLLYDIAKFTEVLEKLFTVLNGQKKGTLGKIKGLFRQPEARERLETCKQELSQMVGLFKAQVTGSTLSQMGQIKKDAKEQHEELVALLENDSALTGSDCSSMAGTLTSLKNDSSGSFGLLPPCPQIFHGRESELQDVVNVLIQDSAHIAILGAGGMGKISLATVAVHNPQVEAKYSHRYSVPCHSSPTCTELAVTIADHIGLEKGSNMAKKMAHYFAHAPPSPLVLDNLETPWEALSARSEVEEFLSLLTDTLHLGLMITLRGAEHPSKVKWTHPFLAPLEPLSNVAAQQTFIEVADEGHDNASTFSVETGKYSMLSDGYDQRSSLDISIMLSYTSSRMTRGAQELLSILSMLPDGLADANLVQAQLPIPDILSCKATLIQIALAFVDQDQHLKVLVPIREHILSIHPPSDALKLKLWEHFHQILDLWHQFRLLNIIDILPQISGNLGNFNTVLHDGLELGGPDIVQNLRSILFLNDYYYRVHDTYSPLLLQLSGQMLHWKDNQIFGECLIELLKTSAYLPDLDLNSDITLGTEHFTSKDPLEKGRWYHALGLYFRFVKSGLAGALQYSQTTYSLAESTGYPTIVGYQALATYGTSMDKLGLSTFKEKVTYIWQTIGMLNIVCKNPDTSWLLLVEIHLVKSEYLESHKPQVAIASSCQPTSHKGILANLNMAIIDITTGADSKIIHQNVKITKSHLRALYGYFGKHTSLVADSVAAELCLRDGAIGTVNALFEQCFALSLDIDTDLALLCAERLGDLSTGMNDIPTTLQ